MQEEVITSLQVGILYLVTPVVMVVASPVTGWLYDRTHSRYYAAIGMLVAAAAFVAMGFVAL